MILPEYFPTNYKNLIETDILKYPNKIVLSAVNGEIFTSLLQLNQDILQKIGENNIKVNVQVYNLNDLNDFEYQVILGNLMELDKRKLNYIINFMIDNAVVRGDFSRYEDFLLKLNSFNNKVKVNYYDIYQTSTSNLNKILDFREKIFIPKLKEYKNLEIEGDPQFVLWY